MPAHLAGRICGNLFGGPGGTGTSLQMLPFGILGYSWVALSAIALLASLLMLVLLYMFAALLRNQQLIVWTKFELYQVLATAVVVLFTTGAIVVGMCTFDIAFLGGPPVSPGKYDPATNPYAAPNGDALSIYEVADMYFARMEEIGGILFGYLMYVVKQITFLSKVTWTSSPLGVGSSESPLESLGQLNNLMFIMVSGYVVSYLLLLLQTRMLDYLAIAVLLYLYPFGIFFRSFEPTRLFGGTLIGLSIALFLFYPIIIVFNHYIMYKSMDDVMQEVGEAAETANDQDNQLNQKFTRANDVKAEFEKMTDEAQRAGFITGIAGAFLFLIKPVMFYFIGAVVLPVINFIVLVEITRGITRTFGDEIDITNLTRMI